MWAGHSFVDARMVGIVTVSVRLFRHGVSGGDVRDEEIVNCPVVSGSGPSGRGGSFGTDGAERVLGVGGSAGVFAGLGYWDRQLASSAEHVDAGDARRCRPHRFGSA